MGASDWAGRMIQRIERDFGTPEERNLRLTGLVRLFASDPKYEPLSEDFPSGKRREEWEMFHDDLPQVLREQSGDTIEERWNNLMDELGYQNFVEEGVYLIPWEEYDEDRHYIGATKERP